MITARECEVAAAVGQIVGGMTLAVLALFGLLAWLVVWHAWRDDIRGWLVRLWQKVRGWMR